MTERGGVGEEKVGTKERPSTERSGVRPEKSVDEEREEAVRDRGRTLTGGSGAPPAVDPPAIDPPVVMSLEGGRGGERGEVVPRERGKGEGDSPP